ncbi:MAG TPA: ATP-binding cassette domain-containing protein, partial [Coleofasciculaceae cyanobacterium]
VDGNGQRELADTLAGLLPIAQGQVRWLSQSDAAPASPFTPKIGYIPEDRQRQGLVLSFTIARNLILKAFWQLPFCRNFFLQEQQINQHADVAIEKFDIRASSSKLKAHQLSGGNQQKIILARELEGEPDLIIAMQPTRGLDIGATAYVQQALLAQRQRGAAILYISTELEEVMAMSDRIAVIYAGQFLDILDGETATVAEIGLLMAGGQGRCHQEMPS